MAAQTRRCDDDPGRRLEGGTGREPRQPVGHKGMVGRIFLGRYEALKVLGEGGMGRVYLARQIDLGRQVVVKVMHDHLASDPLFCERYYRNLSLTGSTWLAGSCRRSTRLQRV